jgi:Mg-chelatase subunit ChlD
LEEDLELSNASSWDIATRYHEFKAKKSLKHLAKRLRKISAASVLERAEAVLGSVVHPVTYHNLPLSELPSNAEQVDFDVEETLEALPLPLFDKKTAWTDQDIWMSHAVHKPQSIILTVDTSLSMTGEKLALTAVAIAVVLLQFPDDPIGVVAFENQSTILKHPDERISISQLVERFLDVPAQGYTHLEDGLKASIQMLDSQGGSGHGRPASTVLLTDGKYTAGRDPAYLAHRFNHLVVLKMGNERASLSLCQELAHKGKGSLREVPELEALPQVMYAVVKDLLRGRFLS